MSEVADLTRDYRVACQRYLSQRSEAALTLGYQIGRRAVDEQGVSLLDLVSVHHVVLAEVLDASPDGGDHGQVIAAASEFLLEVLSTFDMAHRSLGRANESGQTAD
ncbi:phosphatase RsbU N-terminal domain-containing protein [Knoellia sp. S7-12]|uniref:phosphatase RsbU N-terminal domain-containing protein n=1 Tax=Knoellia sp. S7-12 TaxID=3126698 RepID=UPI003368C09E